MKILLIKRSNDFGLDDLGIHQDVVNEEMDLPMQFDNLNSEDDNELAVEMSVVVQGNIVLYQMMY